MDGPHLVSHPAKASLSCEGWRGWRSTGFGGSGTIGADNRTASPEVEAADDAGELGGGGGSRRGSLLVGEVGLNGVVGDARVTGVTG